MVKHLCASTSQGSLTTETAHGGFAESPNGRIQKTSIPHILKAEPLGTKEKLVEHLQEGPISGSQASL